MMYRNPKFYYNKFINSYILIFFYFKSYFSALKSEIYLPIFSSNSCKVLLLYLIPEPIWNRLLCSLYSRDLMLFSWCGKSVVPEPLLNSPSFSPVDLKVSLVVYIHQSVSRPSVLFHWTICLS